MTRFRAFVLCCALAGVPLLSACEPSPPPPTTPPPARIAMHFQAIPGAQVSYWDGADLSDVWIAGPDPDDPDVCQPVILDDTLTFGLAAGPGNSTPVYVVTGGELLVEVDNRAECYTRSEEGDGLDQSIYSVGFSDYEAFAAFDPIRIIFGDIRAFVIVK